MELKDNEFKVASIKRGIGPITKRARRFGAGSEYVFGVVYVLADGREIATVDAHSRLRDAKKEEASLPHVSRNNHTVTLREDGTILMEGHRYGTIELLGGLGQENITARDILLEREALGFDQNGNDITVG